MTNWEQIKQFDEEHMIKFLADLTHYCDDAPWLKWFNNKFCNNDCPVIDGSELNLNSNAEYCFCEVNHYCKPYFELTGVKVEVPTDEQILNLWLKEKAND